MNYLLLVPSLTGAFLINSAGLSQPLVFKAFALAPSVHPPQFLSRRCRKPVGLSP